MKLQNYRTLALCILFYSLTHLVFGQREAHIEPQALEELVDDYVNQNNIPGLSVGIVLNGQLHLIINRGEHKRGTGTQISKTSVFQIGSLSKTFTAIIFNQLSREGKVSAEQPITDFFKEELTDKQLKKLSSITVGSVLNHTAGFPNNGASIPPTPNGAPMLGGYLEAGFLKDLGNMTIDQDKKGKWSYSNFGFAVIGHILEKASGESYEALLQKYILQPYNMGASTSDLEVAKQRGSLVTPYHVHKRKKETQAWEMGKGTPAGGIFSSMNDLSELMIRQMEAYASQEVNSPLILTNETVEINGKMQYGHAFFYTKNALDTTIVQYGHGGDLDGFASMYEIYPQFDLGLIMLTSSGGQWINGLKNLIEAKFFNLPTRQEIKLSRKKLKLYEGKYDFESGQSMDLIVIKDRLMARFKGTDPIPLMAETETNFFFLSMNSQIEFELNDKNQVSQLIYIQDGRKIYPKRVK